VPGVRPEGFTVTVAVVFENAAAVELAGETLSQL
jgi:hypothetical protein